MTFNNRQCELEKMLEIGKVAGRKQPKSHEKDANFSATPY